MDLGGLKEESVVVKYFPTKTGILQEQLMICVDDATTMPIDIRGEALPLQLSTSCSIIQFESVMPQQHHSKRIELRNRSPIPLTMFMFETATRLKEKEIHISEEKKWSIPGRDRRELVVTYSPLNPVETFHEMCFGMIEGAQIELFAIEGSCKSTDLVLSEAKIDFGSIHPETKRTERLLLSNIGNEEHIFVWKSSNPVFSIEPEQGVLLPNQRITISIHFESKTPLEILQSILFCCTPGFLFLHFGMHSEYRRGETRAFCERDL